MSKSIVKGLPAMDKQLKDLSQRMSKTIVRGALRDGTKVVLQAARDTVPVGPPSGKNAKLYGAYEGALRDSLKLSTRAKDRKVSAHVTAGGRVPRMSGAAFWAPFVEFGTRPHSVAESANRSSGRKQTKGPRHPGIAPQPFLGPALETNARALLQAASVSMFRRLERKGFDLSGLGDLEA